VALRAEFTQENRILCEKLAKCETSRQRENAALREQQDGFCAQSVPDIGTLKQQLAEDIANVQREQTKSEPRTEDRGPRCLRLLRRQRLQ
jgi:hypothetical protein